MRRGYNAFDRDNVAPGEQKPRLRTLLECGGGHARPRNLDVSDLRQVYPGDRAVQMRKVRAGQGKRPQRGNSTSYIKGPGNVRKIVIAPTSFLLVPGRYFVPAESAAGMHSGDPASQPAGRRR